MPGTPPEPPSSAADSPACGRDDLLALRRRWYRSFPDGPLEFIAATRLLWVVGLFVLPLMPAVERVYGAIALGALFTVDAGLALLWMAQIAADRNCWLGRSATPPPTSGNPWWFRVALTILSYVLLLAFGATFLSLPWETARTHPGALAVIRWLFFVGYLVSLPFVWSSWRSLATPGRLATALLAVPVLHWWAVRHIGARLADEFARHAGSGPSDDAVFSRAAVMAANVLWALWLVVAATILAVSGLQAGLAWQSACCSLLAAIAAIADVAAIESIQRAYLAYVHRPRNAPS